VKSEILGVKEETLIKYGAVSEETAIEMAEGVRKCLDSDIGISTTGIAGPGGGTVTKPVGLVYCGFVSEQGIRVRKFHFHFNRKMNKRLSSQVALNMIRLELENA
ncbi:MAG: nicotinamide-nucleotide amidohydrolase family protein, partial [Candidatus Marinimicrobia bacterium]|nr:nicotinamide-nucleotide amidohydrolase family protein [Candidatus Neomarinimicrobiota bacterium]